MGVGFRGEVSSGGYSVSPDAGEGVVAEMREDEGWESVVGEE